MPIYLARRAYCERQHCIFETGVIRRAETPVCNNSTIVGRITTECLGGPMRGRAVVVYQRNEDTQEVGRCEGGKAANRLAMERTEVFYANTLWEARRLRQVVVDT